MKIIFDNKEIQVSPFAINLVQAAKENGITIVAPCYKAHSGSCCHSCLVEIDGKEAFACGTKPYEGMIVHYDREDLNKKRAENLKKYSDKLKEIDRLTGGLQEIRKVKRPYEL